ncbi:MAG TPA: winged helix-turn-helix transcriptional regulator [Noviherbaspirillum sp.]|uniref:winged helix-turn-helix transcriptional regulator n=1 Tax=Noviherbaspirillum sp. TaxID=1926288 RepID=UPI002B468D99|nr:winged helix-turn-helix transcriptional regulator [Noviherbaspirillum sp.]HJV86288.1 winged helix-turn-helix transcriptional regulator [Noviherbaspirillum sp.]
MATRKIIEPGKSVRNSRSGQAIMALLDLLGRRWALRILWELRTGERLSFRALQETCQISSPNALNTRLKELRHAGIVDLQNGGGYGLTLTGHALLKALGPLASWADDWARSVGREDLACYSRSRETAE